MSVSAPHRFFFYGTLAGGHDNSFARIVRRHMQPIGSAFTAGTLWAIPTGRGWYPALVRRGDSAIAGSLYTTRSSFRAEHLALIDGYEECRPRHRPASLYWREPIAVICPDGCVRAAQAYVLAHRPPRDAISIEGGDFGRWLTMTGHRPFAPLARTI